jgi:hypothetical protein
MALDFSTTPTAKPARSYSPVRVHARHLGGFTADQRTASQFAALGNAADDRSGGVDIELAAGEVVEEEQRFGTEDQDVIDAHRDQILTDRIVSVQLESQAQLGTDAIRAGNQDRLLVALRHFEQRAEAADTAEHAFAQRLLGHRLDTVDKGIARIDIDAGITVGKGSVLGHGQLGAKMRRDAAGKNSNFTRNRQPPLTGWTASPLRLFDAKKQIVTVNRGKKPNLKYLCTGGPSAAMPADP